MTSVSVIIPTYNRGHVLARALDSVLQQSQPAQEIIVVDDGSTDDTSALIQKNYPSVCYLRQDNQGVSAARNHGIKAATGDWVALLDSDDEWLPHKLKIQLALIARQPDYPLVHSDEIWLRNGERVNQMNKHAKAGGWIFQRCLPLCAISPSAVMIKRGLFDEVGLFDESLPACEDYDLWLRICSRHAVSYVDEALIIKYGGHDDQLSRKYWGMDRFRITALDKLLKNESLKSNDADAALKMLAKKVRVYAKGARKRGKEQEALDYESILKSHGQ